MYKYIYIYICYYIKYWLRCNTKDLRIPRKIIDNSIVDESNQLRILSVSQKS